MKIMKIFKFIMEIKILIKKILNYLLMKKKQKFNNEIDDLKKEFIQLL